MSRYNRLIPKENKKKITPEQKAFMIEKVYGRKRETEEDMPYTLPTAAQQKEEANAAILAAAGYTSEQVEALRLLLGVPPRATMKPPIGFDLNDPPAPQPPPGGWKNVPCIVHRLNPKTGQNESKVCRTAEDRNRALEYDGWHVKPQAAIEVDSDPEVSQEELMRAFHLDKLAKKKTQAVMVKEETPEDEPKRRGRPPGSGKNQEEDSGGAA
jgi:hypothetical protein